MGPKYHIVVPLEVIIESVMMELGITKMHLLINVNNVKDSISLKLIIVAFKTPSS